MKETIKEVITVTLIIVVVTPLALAGLAFGIAYGFAGIGVLADNAAEWYCEAAGGSYEWRQGKYSDYKDCVAPK